MFIDELEITLKAGNGGPGKVSFRPAMGGPDGGNGGRGGDVYVVAVQDLMVLGQYQGKHSLKAEDGESGGSKRSSGKDGNDLYVAVPIGTSITNQFNDKTFELNNVGEQVLVARGGLGGKGNFEFKSSTNTTPRYAQKGLAGQERNVKLVVKLIADFGLIGLPNAGKSSLLNELTAAHVKTANYPFTTLEPNLGVFQGKVLADIPGLIEGASVGKGLGIRFLKHIEKVGLLIHCISSESADVVKDYKIINQEMKQFDASLLAKKQLILLTKADLIDKQEINKKIKQLIKFSDEVYPISIHDWESLEKLKKILK